MGYCEEVGGGVESGSSFNEDGIDSLGVVPVNDDIGNFVLRGWEGPILKKE